MDPESETNLVDLDAPLRRTMFLLYGLQDHLRGRHCCQGLDEHPWVDGELGLPDCWQVRPVPFQLQLHC